MNISEIVKGLPPTRKIYLENSYARKADAEVLRVVKEKGKRYYLVLNSSLFHPLSGGQASDKGWLYHEDYRFEVKKVLENSNIVVLYGKIEEGRPPKEGDKVIQELDWERRYLIMRLHTAGHVIDRAVTEILGVHVNTLGALHGPPEAYVEYTAEISPNVLSDIERVSNEILDDREVVIKEVPSSQLHQVVYGAPNLARLPDVPIFRVVEVSGINAIPCSGTHVRRTSEIGKILLKRVEKIEGGSRLYYWVSNR